MAEWRLCCCCFFVLLCRVSVCGLQFITPYNGKKVTGVLGSSVRFTWTFNKAIVDSVQWGTKMDGVLNFQQLLVTVRKDKTSNSSTDPLYSGRVSGVWGESSPGQATFTLNSIQKADERSYLCRLGPESLSVSAIYDVVQLLVVVPPQISIRSVQPSYNERSSVNISCTASGTPDPDVRWIRDGKVIDSEEKTVFLAFSNINRADDGQYTCKANNSAGNDQKNMTLEVHYPPSIKEASSSAAKSWIGQTVMLRCVSDGVPTPILHWYNPVGEKINNITATQNTVNVKMSVDEDFGLYRCYADNGVTPADFELVKIEQIKKPGSPTIAQLDIQATSLTVNWIPPVDDGGSPVTAYRVVILNGNTETENKNITEPGRTSLPVGDLKRDTKYTVKVFARNAVFEGPSAEKGVKTKYEGVPAAATFNDLQNEVRGGAITLKWSEPESNGKVITQYTVYQRIVTDGKPGPWIKLKIITHPSVRELKVELESGNVYEFVVTATNEFGESLKEEGKVKRVKASGESEGGDGTQTGDGDDGNGMGAALYAGAAAAGVLLIIGIIVIIVLWRRRKPSSDEDTSRDELGSANPYEEEDGYHSVSREAAQSLQASGPAAEPNYAQVDQSRKKKNRMQANEEYAQVDKSKKTKKKKKPGELDYADLEDLRTDIQLGPVPSGGGAAAAPIVRPPAYEGTEYADISQFGVPQPEPDPTYANVPKPDVVYSNVESM